MARTGEEVLSVGRLILGCSKVVGRGRQVGRQADRQSGIRDWERQVCW